MGNVESVLDRFLETLFRLMMESYQRQADEMNLTLPQAHALKVLRHSAMTTGELANQLGISAPAVTQLTDRLCRKQLLERRADSGDRRAVIVVLTGRGRRTVDRFRRRRNEVLSEALLLLEEQDKTQVMAALGKTLAALERYERDARTAREPRDASNKIRRQLRPVKLMNRNITENRK
jgi:DNA-binding MarR family transcriptional regulator